VSFNESFEKKAFIGPLLAGAARLATPLISAATKYAVPAAMKAGSSIMSAAPKVGAALATGGKKIAGKMATDGAANMAISAFSKGKQDVGTAAAGSLLG
jgi:hypothetical protein